jgi:hypothetical protein
MKTHSRARHSLLLVLTATCLPALAQNAASGCFKRTASAVLGVPAPAAAGAPTTGSRSGVAGTGEALTTGAVFRPLAPASGGQFAGIFATYSIAKNTPRGKFPRVALTAETYGGSLPCWTFRATIWQTENSRHDERFELCNAPMMVKDDLGQPGEAADPVGPLMSVITAHQTLPSAQVQVTPERTEGPNPPAMPFAVQVATSTPAGFALLAQYDALIARALYVSDYAPSSVMIAGNGYRLAGTVGSDGRLMWFAGFTPGGNRDARAPTTKE